MHAKVDSFFKEVGESLAKMVWRECYDEKTRAKYYWNMETNKVQWHPPAGFKEHAEDKNPSKKLYIPTPSGQIIKVGPLPAIKECNKKIYRISEKVEPPVHSLLTRKTKEKKTVIVTDKRKRRFSSDSVDEKVIPINSYGSSSESDNDNDVEESEPISILGPHLPPIDYIERPSKTQPNLPNPRNKSPLCNEDFVDLMLSECEQKMHADKQKAEPLSSDVKILIPLASDPSKLSPLELVAEYGDDSDDPEDEEPTPVPCVKEPVNILFPAAKQIDVQQFCDPKPKETASIDESVDLKAFQRKRRIGVSLVNVPKKKTNDDAKEKSPERPGFGFSKVDYPGFKSGGVLFASTVAGKDEEKTAQGLLESDGYRDDELVKEITGMQESLEEKLKFLCEGKEEALPVQIMIIQIQTLSTAMRENCLKPSYLKRWLETTLEDLRKLEREAAPAGWLLQWNRSHKSYFYYNPVTNESQWEYPQEDIVGTDEAMDISTTPPHPSCDERSSDSTGVLVPPPPPVIKEASVSPPPPPIISKCKIPNTVQPLPPGVEELDKFETNVEEKEPKPATNNSFSSELVSFYSDIAAIDNAEPVAESKPEPEPVVASAFSSVDMIETQPPKKKKKVKVASGLAMKKKGVSKLVEKWKNVQRNYD